MIRFAAPIVLSLSFMTAAFAQTPEPAPAPAAATAPAARPTPGSYTGTFQEKDGSRSADVKMTIRHITRDGRVTGTMQTDHPRKACAKRLPLNGMILPPGKGGGMRLTVDDGAPAGCRRIYYVTTAADGNVSGTFIDGRSETRRAAKKGS